MVTSKPFNSLIQFFWGWGEGGRCYRGDNLSQFRACVLGMVCVLGRRRGRVVSASDSQSGCPGFESRSGHLLDLFSVVPS